MNIAILGYYGKYNLGDEAFKDSFKLMLTGHNINFYGIDKDSNIDVKYANVVICGGGDIINSYFIDKLRKILQNVTSPKIFYGVGIPYTSYISKSVFDLFDQVYLRNYIDVPLVSFYANNVDYTPDIVFSHPSLPRNLSNYKKIGVFLHIGLIKGDNKDNTVQELASVLKYLERYGEIHMYAYNTSSSSIEDDRNVNHLFNYISHDQTYTTAEMFSELTTLDYAICGRFHSHVMCTIVGVPFISLSTTRKTRLFMRELQLEKYMVEPILGDRDYVVNIDGNAITNKFELMLRDGKLSRYLLGISENRRNLVYSSIKVEKMTKKNKDIPTKFDDIISYFKEAIQYTDLETVCYNICYQITGDIESKYLWGFYESMKEDTSTIRESVKWIINDHYNT